MSIVRRSQKFLNRGRDSGWVRRIVPTGGGLLICFVVVNVVLAAMFWQRAYPNSRVGGQAIGALSYGAVTPKIGQLKLLPATVSLQQPHSSVTVTPQDLGIQVNTAKIAAGVKQRSWLPVANLFKSHNTPVFTVVDRTVLARKLTALAGGSRQTPTDARIVLENNQFTLAAATNGWQVDVAKAATAVTQAVSEGQSAVRLPMAPIAPSVTEASLQTNLRQLQSAQGVSLSFTYNNKTAKPSAADITGWYVQNGSSYSLQAAKIQAYIARVGTRDGIRVQNLAQAASAAEQAIQAGKALNFTLVAVPPGVCANNTASQLVVVSISQQHMWACEGSSQVYDTPVTTGAYQAGTPTPTGTWHIYAKERNVVLRGPTWNDPVSYWLPFYTDYGFHDASWQTFPFGDPAYASQGSHGCVHLPTPAVAWLYGWSHIGTTVTVTA